MKPLPRYTEEIILAITVAILATLAYLSFPQAAAGLCLNPTRAALAPHTSRAADLDPQTQARRSCTQAAPTPAAASSLLPLGSAAVPAASSSIQSIKSIPSTKETTP